MDPTQKEQIYESGVRVLLDGCLTRLTRAKLLRTRRRRQRGLAALMSERELNGEIACLEKLVLELTLIISEVGRHQDPKKEWDASLGQFPGKGDP